MPGGGGQMLSGLRTFTGGGQRKIQGFRTSGFLRARVIEVDIEDKGEKNLYGSVRVAIPDHYPPGVIEKALEDYDEDKTGTIAYPANNYMGGFNDEDKDGESYYQASVAVPRKGDWVWVFFEDGKPDRCFYHSSIMYRNCRLPPENLKVDEPHRVITLCKTHSGRAVIVCDSEDQQRVEITGKKRLQEGPPSGGHEGVYNIDKNQTTILFDEREGKEKILVRTHKGDFIHIDIDERQLQLYFKENINIFTAANLNLTTKGKLNIMSKGDINISSGGEIKLSAKSDFKIHSGGIVSSLSESDTFIDADTNVYIQKKGAKKIKPVVPDPPHGQRDT